MVVMVSPLLLALAVTAGLWLHGYALTAAVASCAVGHLAGRSVLRQGMQAGDPGRRSQAPLLAMLVRMFVAVPLLLVAIFAAGELFPNAGGNSTPRHARFVVGLWAAAAYVVMVALETRAAAIVYRERTKQAPGRGSPGCKTDEDR